MSLVRPSFLLLCLLPVPVSGAGGKSIFKLGSDVDEKSWDVMGMYFIVFGITILFELIVHKLHHSVTSDSGQSIVHHVTQEVMILGGISAVLVVFENLGGADLIDTALFHYVHFVVFVMAIFFITLVSSLFFFVDNAWSKWTKFEHKISEIESDPSLDFDSKAAFLQQYIRSIRSGQRMLASLIFFRQNVPAPLSDVSFSRYMKKMQRKFMLGFLDLHTHSWALLSLLCLVAAAVTAITIRVSDNELATIGLWTLFVGFGPLLVLIIAFFKIRNEYHKFTSEVLQMRMDGHMRPSRAQQQHFWWSKPERMVLLLQTMLLYQVFFLATASVNFSTRLVAVRPHGWMLLFVCFIPSSIVFLVMVPLVLPPFTILASLGDFLDHDALLRMKAQDKASGKFRRIRKREDGVAARALFLHEDDTVLQKFTQQAPASAKRARKQGAGDPLLGESGPPQGFCEECEEKKACFDCYTCGKLCADCDFMYHKLKQMAGHQRKQIAGTRRKHGEELNPLAPSSVRDGSFGPGSSSSSTNGNSSSGGSFPGRLMNYTFPARGVPASPSEMRVLRSLPALPPPPRQGGRGTSTGNSHVPRTSRSYAPLKESDV